MKMKTISDLIHHYVLKAENIRRNLPNREKWGHGPWDKHEMAKDLEFAEALQSILPYYPDGKLIAQEPVDDIWHDADDPPTNDRFILLRFGGLEMPMVGRYEGHPEIGGNYFIGCREEPAIMDNLIVTMWTDLPGYKTEVVTDE